MSQKTSTLRTVFQSGKIVQRIAKATIALGLLVSAPSMLTARSLTTVSVPPSVGVSISGPSSFCPGSSATLTANYTAGSGSTSFVWKRNGVFMPGATTASIVVTNPGDYTVAATSSGLTSTSAVFTLSRLTLKTNVQNACPGSTGNVNLVVQNGTAPFSYLWSNGQTSQDLMAVSNGYYSVAVTDANGCVATTIAMVNNTPVNIQAGENKTICNGSSTSLQASGADLYFWSPADGLSSANVSNPTANPTSTKTYTVTGYVASGELVTNGDFNQGNKGILSNYAYVNSFANVAVGYTSGTGLYPEAKYAVVSNRNDSNVTKFHPAFVGVGRNGGSLVGRNEDNYMAINGSTVLDQVVWSQTVEVLPGNNYSFSCWIASINASNPSKLRFLINGVELGPQIVAPSTLNSWIQFYTVWNSASATTATISIINDNTIAGGNDFGLDDISFSTTCSNTSTVTVFVNDGIVGNSITAPATTQNCLSVDAAEIVGNVPTGGSGSFSYQWQISTDNSTWDNIEGAISQSYNPGVVYTTARYRRVVTSGACTLESNIVTITISSTYTISNNTITAPATSSFCTASDPANIVGSSPNASGSGSFTYIWLSSNDGNEFVEIPGATLSSYNPGMVSQTTYFRRIAKKGTCTSAPSNIVVITINEQPSISVVSGGTVCGSGSATLEVASAGSTISWFASQASSTVLYTGSAYTTPSVSTTTDFYAQATSNGCSSAKIPVSLTVNSNPSVESIENGSVCEMGDVTVSAVASEGTISWYTESVEGNLVGTGNTFMFNSISNDASVYAQASNNGCVSARSVANATIKHASSSEEIASACGSYTWNEVNYTTSGDKTYSTVNAAGCDSIATLHLTINQPSSSEEIASACGSYTWNEVNYTTSGDKTYSTVNAAGCDSIATLHLTIIARPTITSTTPGFLCGNGNATVVAAASAGDVNWFADAAGSLALGSGNSISVPVTESTVVYALANNEGCTSTETSPVAITVGENTTASVSATSCDTYTWALNGQTYTSSGAYYATSTNAAGCTLTTTLNLTINTSSAVTLNASINQGEVYAFNDQNLTTGGTYTMNSTGVNGCPMVTTLNLTVVPTPPTAGSCYAEQVMSFNQKKRNDGTYVDANRSNPSKALGAPENNDTYNFVSLGFGGDITLKFGSPIKNGTGNDVRVIESSFGNISCARYPEKIRAYASQDGCNFIFMGEGCQDTDFDLGSLAWAQYIKLVDMSNPSATYQGTPVADAYDLDGIMCLNGYESNPIPATITSGANQVVNYTPGTCKNGTAVPVSRRNPANALGLPQGNDVVNFVALGFGGTLTLKFNYVIFDNPASNDLQVVETSYGNPTCAAYPERALIEGSLDGVNWIQLGQLCQDGQVDINSAGVVQYIRLTDRSAASSFSGTADGYDVDGVIAINPTCGSVAARSAADQVVDVINVPNEEVSSSLYPNPASDITTLSIDGTNANETWTVSIADLSGRVISTTTFVANEGISEHRISVSELSFGIYQIVATNGSNKIVQKLVH